MDLFIVAKANGQDLHARMQAVSSSLSLSERTSLKRFADRVRKDGHISINMRQSVLLSFLVSSAHQNIYEWAAARAVRSTKTQEEIMRQQLGTYYEKRTAFDGFFTDGDKLRYGALNVGGAGASHYGDFCTVVKSASAEHKFRVAYLRGDSLKTYMLPASRVDGTAVERDAAPHSHRHCIATIKHARDVVGTAETDWPTILCNSEDFIEAIFAGEFVANDIECVRMIRADHEALYEFAFEDFQTKLNKSEKIEIDNFILILDELVRCGIRLEVV